LKLDLIINKTSCTLLYFREKKTKHDWFLAQKAL